VKLFVGLTLIAIIFVGFVFLRLTWEVITKRLLFSSVTFHLCKTFEIPFNSFDTSKAACHVRAMLRSRTYYYESYLSTTVIISVSPYYKDFLFFFFNIKEKPKTKN